LVYCAIRLKLKDYIKILELKMKEYKKIFIIVIFCLSAIVIFSLTACASQGQVSSTNVADITAAETTAITETTAANSVEVICKNNRFQLDTLTISVGTTVTWVNQDGYIHTVTSGTSPSEPSGLFDSGNLSGGQTFSFTFDKAGTYDYFCIPHYSLGMIGKVIVNE